MDSENTTVSTPMETEEQNTLFEEVAEVEVQNSDVIEREEVVEEDDEDLDDDMLEELLNAESEEEEVEDVNDDNGSEDADNEENTSSAQTENKVVAASDKITRLPLSRIKQIIKLDSDVDRVNGEAAFLIAKSAELFLQSFAKEIYKVTARSKKKTIQMRDVNTCIDEVMCMQFLEGCHLEQL